MNPSAPHAASAEYVKAILGKLKPKKGDVPTAVHELTGLERSLRFENISPLAPADIPGWLMGRDVPADEVAIVRELIARTRQPKKKAAPVDTREEWEKGYSMSDRIAHLSGRPRKSLGDVILGYQREGLDANAAWTRLMKDTVLLPQFTTDVPATFGQFLKVYGPGGRPAVLRTGAARHSSAKRAR